MQVLDICSLKWLWNFQIKCPIGSWIKESGALGVGGKDLGCRYRLGSQMARAIMGEIKITQGK